MSHRERKQQVPIERHDDMEIMRRVIDRFGLKGTSMAASLTGFIARKRGVPDSHGPADDGLARAGDRMSSACDDGENFAAGQRDLGLGPALAKQREAESHVAGGYGQGEGDGEKSSQPVAVDSAGGGTPQAKKVIDSARETSHEDDESHLRDAEVLSRALRRLGISESTTAVEGWVAQRNNKVGASSQLTGGAKKSPPSLSKSKIGEAEVLSRALRRLGISESTTAVEGWVAQRNNKVGASSQLTGGAKISPPSRLESESTEKIQPPSSLNPIEEDAVRRHRTATSPSLSNGMSRSEHVGSALFSSPPAARNVSTCEQKNSTASHNHPIERDSPQKSGSASSSSSSSSPGSPRTYGGAAAHRHAVEQDFAKRRGAESTISASPGMTDSHLPKSSLEFALPTPAMSTLMESFSEQDSSELEIQARKIMIATKALREGDGAGTWHSSSYVKNAPSKGTVVGDEDPILHSQTGYRGQEQHGSQNSHILPQASQNSVVTHGPHARANNEDASVRGPPAAKYPTSASRRQTPMPSHIGRSPVFGTNDEKISQSPHDKIPPLEVGTAQDERQTSGASTIGPLNGAKDTAHTKAKLLRPHGGKKHEMVSDKEWNVVTDATSHKAGEKETMAVTGANLDKAQDSNQLRVKAALDESVSLAGKTHGQGLQKEFVSSDDRHMMRKASVPEDGKSSHIESATSSLHVAQGSAWSVQTASAASSVSGADNGVERAQAMPVNWTFQDRTCVASSSIPPAPQGGFCWQKGVDDAGWRGALDGVKAHDARRRYAPKLYPKAYSILVQLLNPDPTGNLRPQRNIAASANILESQSLNSGLQARTRRILTVNVFGRYAFAQPLAAPEGSKKMRRAGMTMADAWTASGGMSRTVLEVVESVMRPLVDRRPLVLLRGGAGSGKTTILWEVERRLAGKRSVVYASGLIDSVSKLSGESRNDRHGLGKSFVHV